jgi:hypothetical protein
MSLATRALGVLAAFSLVVGLSGCASATLTPLEQSYLEEVRRFADATGRMYARRPPHVTAGATNNPSQGGGYRSGYLYVTPGMLESQHRDALVAHELAHWLLDHDTALSRTFDRPMTQGEWSRMVEPLEKDANAKAVEIIVRVRGYPEPTALRLVYLHLETAHRNGVELLGHASACEEIRDLLGRFPQHRSLTRPWTCAPSGS